MCFNSSSLRIPKFRLACITNLPEPIECSCESVTTLPKRWVCDRPAQEKRGLSSLIAFWDTQSQNIDITWKKTTPRIGKIGINSAIYDKGFFMVCSQKKLWIIVDMMLYELILAKKCQRPNFSSEGWHIMWHREVLVCIFWLRSTRHLHAHSFSPDRHKVHMGWWGREGRVWGWGSVGCSWNGSLSQRIQIGDSDAYPTELVLTKYFCRRKCPVVFWWNLTQGQSLKKRALLSVSPWPGPARLMMQN